MKVFILNHKNNTPLHYAARFDSKAIGEVLILNGANVNAKNHLYYNMK